jgi:hypothetical protein
MSTRLHSDRRGADRRIAEGRSSPDTRPDEADRLPPEQLVLSLQRAAGNASVARLLAGGSSPRAMVQREIVLGEPTFKLAEKSPAQQLVDSAGTTFDMGNTEPFINDASIWEKPSLELPDQDVVDSKAGVDYAGDADDDVAEAAWNKDRYSGWNTSEPVNAFGWEITLPPPVSQWRVDGVEKAKLEALAKTLGATDPAITPETGSLVMTDEGTNIDDHTKVHERQHHADHLNLIDALVGPWDRYQREHLSQATAVNGDSRWDVKGQLLKAGGFTPGAPRVVEELKSEMKKSGNSFHATDAGAYPDVKVKSVDATTGEVVVSAKPKKAMTEVKADRYTWKGKRIPG